MFSLDSVAIRDSLRIGESMIPPFDIFKSEPDGHVLWIGTRDDLDAAKEFVRQYGHSKPGEYLICSLKTNNRISMTVPEENSTAASQKSPITGNPQFSSGR
jgi:hypothetical protein